MKDDISKYMSAVSNVFYIIMSTFSSPTCLTQRYGDLYSRVLRAFDIWRGFGMSLQGVKSCGDYMFSGHTSIITILNFLITECKFCTPLPLFSFLLLCIYLLLHIYACICAIFIILFCHFAFSSLFVWFYILSIVAV